MKTEDVLRNNWYSNKNYKAWESLIILGEQ